jgi:hypothetical protein
LTPKKFSGLQGALSLLGYEKAHVAGTYLKVKGLLGVMRFEVQMTAEVEVGK